MNLPGPRLVVVGSGLAGYGLLRELRRRAPEAQLTLVTADDGHFYSKPALSTALAKAKAPEQLVTTPADRISAQLGLNLLARTRATSIDRNARVLETTTGSIPYDALALALGAAPVRLSLGGDAAELALSVNDLDAYRQLRAQLSHGDHVLVIGAGLVGCEFANDLAAIGHPVTVADPLAHPLAQLIPPEAGAELETALRSAGVNWRLGAKVLRLDHAAGTRIRAEFDTGDSVEADLVLSAVGIRPHTDLAKASGLKVGRGVSVDLTGRTSDPAIYALGDCAEYPQGLAAFITPIMPAARVIAANMLGAQEEIRFPALSVQVKTTACPLVLLAPAPGAAGSWTVERTDNGARHMFRDPSGKPLGYVLVGDAGEARIELDREIAALGQAEIAA